MNTASTAIAGHVYLAFLADTFFWSQKDQAEITASDVVLKVDGVRYEQNEITPDTIKPESQVTIASGDVFEFFTPIASLKDHFENWSASKENQAAAV